MNRIIYDFPGDDPNEESPKSVGRYDYNPIYQAVTTVLDASRPDRYQERDVAWQTSAEELAFKLLKKASENDTAASEAIIRDAAIRAVRNREGVAKSRGGDLFAIAADQLPLGYGDREALREFLRDRWHLPIKINDNGDMVRLGAMRSADWSELDAFQKQKSKEEAARNQAKSDGIGIFKGLAETNENDIPLEGFFNRDDRG